MSKGTTICSKPNLAGAEELNKSQRSSITSECFLWPGPTSITVSHFTSTADIFCFSSCCQKFSLIASVKLDFWEPYALQILMLISSICVWKPDVSASSPESNTTAASRSSLAAVRKRLCLSSVLKLWISFYFGSSWLTLMCSTSFDFSSKSLLHLSHLKSCASFLCSTNFSLVWQTPLRLSHASTCGFLNYSCHWISIRIFYVCGNVLISCGQSSSFLVWILPDIYY